MCLNTIKHFLNVMNLHKLNLKKILLYNLITINYKSNELYIHLLNAIIIYISSCGSSTLGSGITSTLSFIVLL